MLDNSEDHFFEILVHLEKSIDPSLGDLVIFLGVRQIKINVCLYHGFVLLYHGDIIRKKTFFQRQSC